MDETKENEPMGEKELTKEEVAKLPFVESGINMKLKGDMAMIKVIPLNPGDEIPVEVFNFATKQNGFNITGDVKSILRTHDKFREYAIAQFTKKLDEWLNGL